VAWTSALVSGIAYHGFFHHDVAIAAVFIEFSVIMASGFVLLNVLRNEYDISLYLNFAGHARRVFFVWNISFLIALAFVIMTKQLAEFSRGSVLLLYGIGLFSVICERAILVSQVKTNAVLGKISAVRIVLVGQEAEIRDFMARYTPRMFGADIVASFVLRDASTLQEDLALAAASARVLDPDDIYILVPWSDTAAIEACVDTFEKIPSSIHLGPQRILDRFSNMSVSRVGKIHSFNIVRRPLSNIDVMVKRTFDLAIGIPALVGLLPLFLLVAVAIKLDSKGPVFFLQRRYGFNQATFRIVKFRSMSVAEDDRAVRQAVRGDPRVTRVGRILRRFNIDELPQLLNVIRGEMSLVGPRPHALAHNQYYARSIADYARRHNVKPGITGWAQIHGLRGEVRSESMMRERLEHDLYYIDNWTLGLDLRILPMTLLSQKSFANAY
jgi:Undecaprenyl-phosphate glucose phosphotransferase